MSLWTEQQTIVMSKVSRFEVDDLLRKGYRAYKINVANKEEFCKMLYYRYYLDNFYIGKTLFVKDRREE